MFVPRMGRWYRGLDFLLVFERAQSVSIQKLTFPMVLCSLLGTGCVHTQYRAKELSLAPLPESIRVGADYPRKPIAWDEKVSPANPSYEIRHFELAVPLADAATNKTVELDCYTPRVGKPLPVILIFPISGGGYFLEELFAKYFYRHGYAAIIVYREAAAERDPRTAQDINRMIRQSVLDNQRVVDWLETRPEYDAKRVGVLGTSLGSLKATFLVAVDPRIKAAVLGLAGGDLPYILAYSKEGAWHHRGLSPQREAYLSEHHLTRDEFRHLLEREVVWDPKAVAPSIDPAKVFMVIGLCDTVVPTRTGLELRRLMHKPKTLFVVSGHYTAYFYLAHIKSQALRFLNTRLRQSATGPDQ